MGARIAKYPPIQGIGYDVHMVMPPSQPPVPPSPVNPAPIPSYGWIATINNPAAGFAITGKWSWYRVTTEGIGNLLLGHDWGMGQMHMPLPPVTATPSIAIRTLASSTKYWLPSTPNKDPQDGSARGGPGSVAISFPAWCIPTQNCQDISGWPFVGPTSICFQLVSTREVGFTWGDVVNGLINMAGDAVGALIGRALGGPTVSVGAALAGAATNAFVEHVTGLLPPDAQNAAKVLIAGAFAIGLGQGLGEVIGAAAGPAASWGAQEAGGAAGGGGAEQVGMGHGGTPLFD
jgi:hypothetical protein